LIGSPARLSQPSKPQPLSEYIVGRTIPLAIVKAVTSATTTTQQATNAVPGDCSFFHKAVSSGAPYPRKKVALWFSPDDSQASKNDSNSPLALISLIYRDSRAWLYLSHRYLADRLVAHVAPRVGGADNKNAEQSRDDGELFASQCHILVVW
jgi:hypothetical protein